MTKQILQQVLRYRDMITVFTGKIISLTGTLFHYQRATCSVLVQPIKGVNPQRHKPCSING